MWDEDGVRKRLRTKYPKGTEPSTNHIRRKLSQRAISHPKPVTVRNADHASHACPTDLWGGVVEGQGLAHGSTDGIQHVLHAHLLGAMHLA